MKNDGDPNGIRTRVTAVKGRCPGPLDDRVVKSAGNIESLFFRARQIHGLFILEGMLQMPGVLAKALCPSQTRPTWARLQ